MKLWTAGLLKNVRLLRRCAPPKEIDGLFRGRIEIAAVAALLRNDIGGLFSFLCILRIRSGARNDNKDHFPVIAGLAPRSRFDESSGNLKRHLGTFSTAPQLPVFILTLCLLSHCQACPIRLRSEPALVEWPFAPIPADLFGQDLQDPYQLTIPAFAGTSLRFTP